MRLISIIAATLIASGCTTMKPVEMSADQLQEKISAGAIVNVGDSVQIATKDGKTYKFKVSAVTAEQISGKDIDIPVKEIVAVRTREFSGGKTTALAAGGVGLFVIIGGAIAAGAALAGG
jgi:hypothetical protein